MNEETLQTDVLIVGAGPAGLSCAIRLAQQNTKKNQPLSIMVLEKGATVGAHCLSGGVFDPSILSELIPDWREKNAPTESLVSDEKFLWLTTHHAISLPILPSLSNHGNVLLKLSAFMPWFAEQAVLLGVDIFAGFAAEKLILEDGIVKGVMTGPKGEDVPAMKIIAKQTILAEGARGYLSEQAIDLFDLRQNCDPQTYALGVKEVWKIKSPVLKPGSVIHTSGYPLSSDVYGGGFIYQMNASELAIGQVIGLDYANPYLDPHGELSRFKQHPLVKNMLKDAECIGYGARTLSEGGWQSLPQCAFPGGLLVGCSAGLLNVGEMKGIHHAMHAGIIAADTLDQELKESGQTLNDFDKALRASSIGTGLKRVRNIRPAFAQFSRLAAFVYVAWDQWIFRGKAPWTLRMQGPDYAQLKPEKECKPIDYPKPDGQLIFSKEDSLYLSGVHHQEGAPSHLISKNHAYHEENNQRYGAPETRYCPANVYQMTEKNGKKMVSLVSQNCLHCKACEIKNVHQNILWTPPQGGDGPNYKDM
jgi:electron-transferring-flavoprotein dehydrogenase